MRGNNKPIEETKIKLGMFELTACFREIKDDLRNPIGIYIGHLLIAEYYLSPIASKLSDYRYRVDIKTKIPGYSMEYKMAGISDCRRKCIGAVVSWTKLLRT